ncbi:Heterokaryon incompatibility protein 6- OR allele [Apiospora arundinis]
MEWHDDAGCKRPDIVNFGEGRSCLACGSVEPRSILPPIRQQSQIRILHLQHGTFNDPIDCDISIQDLAHHPDYEAVSYTWADESGDATRCRTIHVRGKPLLVTRSCENALRHLRRDFSTRHLWIDAVCIDQENVDERGHQVQLMPRIYSGAKAVPVYIGELTPSSETFLRNRMLSKSDLYKFDPELAEFLSRRYFQRVWILQEVALARQATIVCGSMSVPWSQVSSSLISRLVEAEKDDLSASDSIPPCFRFSPSLYAEPGQEMKLLDLARPCVATDPRDKVFSLLGLILGGLSVTQVYARTAIYLASQFGWLEVLYRAGASNASLNGIPSWVPDWTCRMQWYPMTIFSMPYQPFETGEWDQETNTLCLTFLQVPFMSRDRMHRFITREHDLVATMGNRLFLDHHDGTSEKVVALAVDFHHWHAATTGSGNSPLLSWISPENELSDDIKAPELPEAPIRCIQLLSSWSESEDGEDFVLHRCSDYRELTSLPYLPAEHAVQMFTMTLTEMYLYRVIQLLDYESYRKYIPSDIPLHISGRTVSNKIPWLKHAIETRLSQRNASQPYHELEDLWMKEYQAGNLVRVQALEKSSVRLPKCIDEPNPGGNGPNSVHHPDFVRLNDGFWRLLVQQCMMRETTIKLV